MREVCSARVSDCFLKRWKVRLAMKEATKRDKGVATTTQTVMGRFRVSMKHSVPRMVRMPVKNWEKPMSRPSVNWSASAMTRLTVSPTGRLSR